MPQKLDDGIVGEREQILLYGEPGVGKTFAAGTMPGPVYFLVVGGSNELKTLRSRDFLSRYGEPEVYFDNVIEAMGERGKFENAIAFDAACDLLDEALEADRKGDIHFESIVIENATTFTEVQMNKAIEINYHLTKSKGKTAADRLRKYDIIIPGDNDWGSAQSLMSQFVSWVTSLDKHVCFVAHSYVEAKRDRATREEIILGIKPAFIGKHRTEIPRAFDNVWHMTIHGGDRGRYTKCQTVGDDTIVAKTRYGGVLPTVVRNINLTEAINKMKEEAQSRAGAAV